MEKEVKVEQISSNLVKEKINETIIKMILNVDPKSNGLYKYGVNWSFYGIFANNVNFIESNDCPTMGVTVKMNGSFPSLICIYNKEFVNKLTEFELMFILSHECLHLISNHLNRGSKLDKNLANICMDALINSFLSMEYQDKKLVDEMVSKSEVLQNCWYVNKVEKIVNQKYEIKSLVFETLYNDMLTKQNENDMSKDSNANGQSNPNDDGKGGSNDDGKSKKSFEDVLKEIGKLLDEHLDNNDSLDDETKEKIKQQYIKDIVSKSQHEYSKNWGNVNGNVEDFVNSTRIKERKLNIDFILNQFIKGRLNVDKTWTKLNRRLPSEVKGSNKKQYIFNVVLDVSGSMDQLIEPFLGYIFKNNVTLNMIQVDTNVNSHTTLTKNDVKKMKLIGFGGTNLNPGFEYIVKTKSLMENDTIVLTDGFMEGLDLTKYSSKKRTLIVCLNDKFGLKGNMKNIKIVQIKPEDLK